MTPVQLPEVPEPKYLAKLSRDGEWAELVPSNDWRAEMWDHGTDYVYTAAQLREYATEAVRLNIRQFLPACEALKREAIREQIGGLTRGDPGKIAAADRLIAMLTTPSETNSER